MGELFHLPTPVVAKIPRELLETKFEILPVSLCFGAGVFENPIPKKKKKALIKRGHFSSCGRQNSGPVEYTHNETSYLICLTHIFNG